MGRSKRKASTYRADHKVNSSRSSGGLNGVAESISNIVSQIGSAVGSGIRSGASSAGIPTSGGSKKPSQQEIARSIDKQYKKVMKTASSGKQRHRRDRSRTVSDTTAQQTKTAADQIQERNSKIKTSADYRTQYEEPYTHRLKANLEKQDRERTIANTYHAKPEDSPMVNYAKTESIIRHQLRRQGEEELKKADKIAHDQGQYIPSIEKTKYRNRLDKKAGKIAAKSVAEQDSEARKAWNKEDHYKSLGDRISDIVLGSTEQSIGQYGRFIPEVMTVASSGKAGKSGTAAHRGGMDFRDRANPNRVDKLQEEADRIRKQQYIGSVGAGQAASKLIAKGTEKAEQGMQGLSGGGKFAAEALQGATQLAIDLGIGATGLGMVPMGLRAAGGEVDNAIKSGASRKQALASGVAVGGVEMLTEKIGNMGSILRAGFGKGVADDVVDNLLGKIAQKAASQGLKDLTHVSGRWLTAAAEEGLEEVIAEAVEPGLANAIYDAGNATILSDPQQALADWAHAGALGAVLGGVAGGGGVVAQHRTGANIRRAGMVDDMMARAVNVDDEADAAAAEGLKAVIDSGQPLTSLQVEKLSGIVAKQQQANNEKMDDAVRAATTVMARHGYSAPKDDDIRIQRGEDTALVAEDLIAAQHWGEDTAAVRQRSGEIADRMARLETGEFSNADVDTILSDPVQRTIYEQVTGVELPKAPSEARNAIYVRAADGLVAMAQQQTELDRNDAYQKLVKKKEGSFGAQGQGVHNRLFADLESRGVDRRDNDAVSDLEKAFEIMYNGGKNDYKFSELRNMFRDDPRFQNADVEFLNAAYNAGQADGKAQVRAAARRQAGILKVDGNTKGRLITTNLSEENTPSIEMRLALESIARMTGNDIVLEDKLDNDVEGFYDNREIHIAANVKRPILSILTHEITHFIEDFAPEAWADLRNYVVANAETIYGVDINTLIENKIKQYANAGIKLDREGAIKEIIANTPKLYTDGSIIADIVNANRPLGVRILMGIREALRKIRAAIAENSAADTKWLRADLEAVKQAERLWTDALAKAAENRDAVANETGVERLSLQAFEDGRRVVVVDQMQDVFDNASEAEYGKIAKRIIQEKFAGKVVGIDNKMYVNGVGAKEYRNPVKHLPRDLYLAKMRAAPELDNLLDAGTNFRKEQDGKDGHAHPDVVDGFDYFDTLFKIGDRYFEATINIKNNAIGKLFVDVTKLKDVTQDITNSYGKNPKFGFLRTSSMNSIEETGTKVKGQASIEEDYVTLTPGRINSIIEEYAIPGNTSSDYSKAWIATINPRDFLTLTLSSDVEAKWPEAELDTEELKKTRMMPYLTIDSSESNSVIGHEGRHRMLALANAGITEAPVIIRDISESTKQNKQRMDTMDLWSQDFGYGPVNDTNNGMGADVDVYDVIPVNEKNRGEIERLYGGDTQVQFSIEEPVEQVRDLIAIHNMTEEEMMNTINLGGLPMPSIAVTNMPHDKYGDISVLFGSETVDPEFFKSNNIYGGDAYTPTFPEIQKKLDENVLTNIREKLEGILGLEPYQTTVVDGLRIPSLDEDNVGNALRSNDPYEAYKNDKALQLAYLKNARNFDVAIPTKTGTIRSEGEDFWSLLDDRVPEVSHETLNAMSADEIVETYGPMLTDAVNAWYDQKYAKMYERKPDMKRIRADLGFSKVDGYLNGLIKFREEGLPEVVDNERLDAILDQNVDEEGFKAWVEDLFDGVVEKTGIRNEKDLFTPSGNRRKWESLHDPVTLENVVRAMKTELDAGSAGMFGANPRGAAQKKYRTLDEVRADKDRLRMMGDEEYSAAMEKALDKMSNVCARIADHNATHSRFDLFGAFDVGGYIAEALNKTRSRDGLKRALQNDYNLKVTDAEMDDVMEAIDAIAEVPTGYFEAKPRRAVGLDEIRAVIMPQTASEELKSALSENNIASYEYDPDVEGSRAEAVNKAAEEGSLRFSIAPGMTEEERYRELVDKTINIAPYKSESMPTSEEDMIELMSQMKKQAFPVLKRIATELGVTDSNKAYTTPDLDVEFYYSNNRLDESANKQAVIKSDQKYVMLAQMLTCFDEMINNARLIESHDDRYEGTNRENPDFLQAHVLVSAFTNETGIVPVKLLVKENNKDKSTLHVSIALPEIKRADQHGQANRNGQHSPLSVLSDYSLAELLREVKRIDSDVSLGTSGETIGKYIPMQFLQGDVRLSIAEVEANLRESIGSRAQFGVGTDSNGNIRYSIPTEINAHIKGDGRTESVRNLRHGWMINRKRESKALDTVLDRIGDFMTGASDLYEYLSLDNVKNATVTYRTDEDGNPTSVILSCQVANGEYEVNFDFTTICKKRESFQRVIEDLYKEGVDEIDLTEENIFAINQELQGYGFETACPICFVEARRYANKAYAEKIVNTWNAAVDKVNPNAEYFDFANADINDFDYEAIDKALKNTGIKGKMNFEKKVDALVRSGAVFQKKLQQSDILTNKGVEALKAMSNEKNSLFGYLKQSRGASAPKEIVAFNAYNGEIELLPKTMGKDKTPLAEYLTSIAGARLQSFSDFQIENMYDYMQLIAGMAARKIPAHAYTKEIAFARLFGMTGMKINMSIVCDVDPNVPEEYAGLTYDENGELVYNFSEQTFPWEEAVALQKDSRYSKNVGTILVGMSDAHILKALNDPDIRFIIPYHKSGLPKPIMKTTHLGKATDYTKFQNTCTLSDTGIKALKDAGYETDIKALYEKMGAKKALKYLNDAFAKIGLKDSYVVKTGEGYGDFNLYGDIQETKNPRKTASNYIEDCMKRGDLPLFFQFAGHKNYYKTLYDFDVYDSVTGRYAPQGAVRNVYPGMDITKGETDTTELESIATEYLNERNKVGRDTSGKYADALTEIKSNIFGMKADADGKDAGKLTEDTRQYSIADGATGETLMTDADVRFSIAEDRMDPDLVKRLNEEEPVKVYRAMQLFDGKLYPPMAAVVNGEMNGGAEFNKWEQSEENLENAIWKVKATGPVVTKDTPGAKPYFRLWKKNNNKNGGRGDYVDARYNPYIHTSLSPLNDQFSTAYKRPNMVIVEGYVPKSELSSGYQAEHAKDPVGETEWKSGPVAGELKKHGKPRRVILSRYFKPIREVPVEEAAGIIADIIGDTGVKIPATTVTPALRTALEDAGVAISYEKLPKDFYKGTRYSIGEPSEPASEDDIWSWLADNSEDFVGEDDDMSNVPVYDQMINLSRARREASMEALSEAAKWIRKENETRLTHGLRLDARSVKEQMNVLIRELMVNSDSSARTKNAAVKQAVAAAQAIYPHLLNEDYDAAANIAYDVALDIIEQIDIVNDEMYMTYAELRDYFRATKIWIPEQERGSDYNDLRKKNVGRLRISNSGIELDKIWDELCGDFPGIFNPETNGMDRLAEIDSVLDSFSDFHEEYTSQEMDELASLTAGEIMNIAYEGKPERTFADKKKEVYDRRTKALKERHREAMAAYREKEKARREKAIKEEREKKKAAVEKEKARGEEKLRQQKEKQKQKEQKKREAAAKKKANDRLENHIAWLSERLLKPTDEKHIPEGYRQAVAQLLAVLDTQTERSRKLEEKYGISKKRFAWLKLKQEYQKIAEGESYGFVLDDGLVSIMDELSEYLEDKNLSDANSEQLDLIRKLVAGIRHGIAYQNKAFSDAIKEQTDALGRQTMEDTEEKINKYGGRDGRARADWWFLNESMATPRDYFEGIGSGMNTAFMALRAGMDTHVRDVDFIRSTFTDIFGKYAKKKKPGSELEKWRDDTLTTEFTLESGETIKLNPSQIMSLYCLMQREQAIGHILGSGIIASDVSTKQKLKEKIRGKAKATRGRRVTVTLGDITQIVGSLTEDQREMATKMQDLLNGPIAEWGNETSMKMNGYRKFEEKNYFPIQVEKTYLATDFDVTKAPERVKNPNFSKSTVKGASNPVVIADIFSVVADHCNAMSMYRSFAPAIADFQRIYNHVERDEEGRMIGSVKETLRACYGQHALQYIETFMTDLNGTTPKTREAMTAFINKSLANYKKAAIGFNLRVALQQPTAIIRAMMLISPKYFATPKNPGRAIREMKEHCPIALWKTWGFNNVDMARSMEEIMMNQEWSRADIITMQAYGALDTLTWSQIWGAVKNETKAKHPDVEVGSQEFWDLCNERASEVFDKTQVVDSVFHRSQVMRSTGALEKLMTSFMAEPTRTFNMVWSQMREAKFLWKDGQKAKATAKANRALTVYIANAALVSMAAAVADALRGKGAGDGDDDDKGWSNLYWSNFIQNFIDNANPLGLMPLAKDVVSMVEIKWDDEEGLQIERGYGTQFMALEGLEKLMYSFADWTSDKKSLGEKIRATLEGAGYVFGIPASNVFREFDWMMNRLGALFATEKGEDGSDNFVVKLTEKAKELYNIKLGSKESDDKPSGEEPAEDGGKYKSGKYADVYDEIEQKTEGLSGYERQDKIWDIVTEGYTSLCTRGDYKSLKKMRKILEKTGGDVNKFDEAVLKWSKSGLKKNISDSIDYGAVDRITNYLKSSGLSKDDISEVIKGSDAAKGFQKALQDGDKEAERKYRYQLIAAGLTFKDVEELTNKAYKKGSGTFQSPIAGDYTITSHFGARSAPTRGASSYHPAIDIGVPVGTPVRAADSGKVVYTGSNGGYGISVGVDHGNGYVTYYNHLSGYGVKKGDYVRKGQEIAKSGNTGTSTGPHLDFKILKDGKAVDPEQFIR